MSETAAALSSAELEQLWAEEDVLPQLVTLIPLWRGETDLGGLERLPQRSGNVVVPPTRTSLDQLTIGHQREPPAGKRTSPQPISLGQGMSQIDPTAQDNSSEGKDR